MDFTKFSQITTFILDVDGVLTDGSMHITEEGDFLRKMHVRDGSAMRMCVRAGYRLAVITKGNSKGVRDRLAFLGVNPIFDEVSNKEAALDEMIAHHDIDISTSCYIGDDLADIGVMKRVLLACCPYDADHEVLKISEFISSKKGGQGCVRDIIERVMRCQNTWPIGDGL